MLRHCIRIIWNFYWRQRYPRNLYVGSWIKYEIRIEPELTTILHINSGYQLHTHMAMIPWEYIHKHLYKVDGVKETWRRYLHIYYNGEKALGHEKKLNILLERLDGELLFKKWKSEHKKLNDKYLDVTTTPIWGIQVIQYKEQSIKRRKIMAVLPWSAAKSRNQSEHWKFVVTKSDWTCAMLRFLMEAL
jgi:hypothetical protein